MENRQEEWTELLNLWPLVESEAQKTLLALHVKLANQRDTPDVDAVRLIQGEIQGIRDILSIPRRHVEAIEGAGEKKEKRNG